MTNAYLDDLLKFDGLSAAEELTGKSYKADKETEMLGFGLLLAHNRAKNEALKKAGDTKLSNKLDRYQEIITGMGFELCLQDSFRGRLHGSGEDPYEESYFVYAHRDGLLLAFDTHNSVNVNGGKVWYNWVPKSWDDYWTYTSSGHQDKTKDGTKVYVGDHDCREALVHKITRLRENGTFLNPWPFAHRCMWLASYMDWEAAHGESDKDYKIRGAYVDLVTERRLARCPEWVRTMVAGTEPQK